MVGILPATGSSGLLFLPLWWTIGGLLAKQGISCMASAVLADALLLSLATLWAPLLADSQVSLLHKLLCEFEDHFFFAHLPGASETCSIASGSDFVQETKAHP